MAQLSIRPDLPKMLILGKHDQFSSLASLEKVFQPHKHKAGLSETPNSKLPDTVVETMADCDHFFASHRSALAKKVLCFCDNAHKDAGKTHTKQNMSSDRIR